MGPMAVANDSAEASMPIIVVGLVAQLRLSQNEHDATILQS